MIKPRQSSLLRLICEAWGGSLWGDETRLSPAHLTATATRKLSIQNYIWQLLFKVAVSWRTLKETTDSFPFSDLEGIFCGWSLQVRWCIAFIDKFTLFPTLGKQCWSWRLRADYLSGAILLSSRLRLLIWSHHIPSLIRETLGAAKETNVTLIALALRAKH